MVSSKIAGYSSATTLGLVALLSLCKSQSGGAAGPQAGGAAGPRVCRRVDGRKLLGKEGIQFRKPTIITHILDDMLPAAGAAWEEASLKKKFRKETITCQQLGGSSCFDFDGNQAIPDNSPLNLAGVLPRLGITGDLPGNLFINGNHRAAKRLVESVVNRSSDTPVLTKALEQLRTPRSTPVSLGREGQWNHIHRHSENLFLQMTGRKGWVMFPEKNIPKKYIKPSLPDVLNEDYQEGIFDQRNLCRSVMTCRRYADFAQEDPGTVCQKEAVEEVQRNSAVSRYKGFACEIKQGEALFIPDAWWHGTCNLDAWNAGFTFISQTSKQEL